MTLFKKALGIMAASAALGCGGGADSINTSVPATDAARSAAATSEVAKSQEKAKESMDKAGYSMPQAPDGASMPQFQYGNPAPGASPPPIKNK